MVRTNTLLAGSALALVLGTGPAGALSEHTKAGLSPEQACEASKLEATSRYHRCVTDAYRRAIVQGGEPSDEHIARCDHRFDRAFEWAEAGGACRTPGGPSTLREPVKAQVSRTANNLSNLPPCTVNPGESAVCQLRSTTSAIDLAALVDALNGFGVTDDTTFWIEAWGGNGGKGNTSDGGAAGEGGYAVSTTNLTAYQSAAGTTDMYYYLGHNGTSGQNAGGDGGTATAVTWNDLSAGAATIADTLLVAGGGGGGGGGRGEGKACSDDVGVQGEPGGDGAAAGFKTTTQAIVDGQDGANDSGSDRSGHGGTATGGAPGFGSDYGGGNPIALLGGVGGMHTDPQVGFINSPVTQGFGAGGQGQGDSEYDAGGGGGAGGYAGGGGGVRAFGDTCVSGGGGGGSSFARKPPNSPSCSAAPQKKPDNPNGIAGFVRITFDLGICG